MRTEALEAWAVVLLIVIQVAALVMASWAGVLLADHNAAGVACVIFAVLFSFVAHVINNTVSGKEPTP